MVTFLHALEWPLACLCGWAAGAVARRRKLTPVEAYALALALGCLIAIATSVFGPAEAPRNEQPWQGLIIWAAWAAFGVSMGIHGVRTRGPKYTTLNLTHRDPE